MSMRSDASMNQPIMFKSGDTKTDLRYVFMFSVGQRLIASKIKVFVYIICVYCVYLLCVYKYTHMHVYI